MSHTLTRFDCDAAMTDALVAAACAALQAQGGQQSLLLSGGSSPRQFYDALGAAPLAWSDIHLALVDERWVDADDEGSNTTLIKTTLCAGEAAHAPFTPMKTPHATPHKAEAQVAAAYDALPPIGLSILGMGPDTHTASWFSGAPEYDAVSAGDAALSVAGVTAPASEVTGRYLQRMSITGRFLATSAQCFLILKGADRLALFEESMAHDLSASPIGRAAALLGERLQVFALTEGQ
jgi:6-phosphogluconolactonase